MGVKSRRGKSGGSRFKGKARSSNTTEKRRSKGGDWDSIFKKDIPVYKARDGKNTIRIISPNLFIEDTKGKEKEVGWVGADYWGMDIFVHNSVGDTFTPYLCLQKMLKKPCPICEDRERAEREGSEDEEDEKYIKSLRPKHRVIVYLVDRKSDDPEVQVWSMPRYGMDDEIAKVAYDEDDNSDIPVDCPEDGRNIHFQLCKDMKSPDFGYSGIKLSSNPTEIDNEFLEYVADNPLPDVLQFYSYERIKEVHEGVSDTSSETEEVDEDSGDQNVGSDVALTYQKVQDMDEDGLFELLEEESDITEDKLDEMDESQLRETVCELFDLHPDVEESAKTKAKKMRKRRRG
jgi:hypothetical protein